MRRLFERSSRPHRDPANRKALLLAVCFAFEGCAAGYHWYRTPDLHATRAPDDWSGSTFTVEAPGTVVATAVHSLRAQHGVVAARSTGPSDGKGMTLSFATGPLRTTEWMMLPSFLTFSILPGYAEDDEEVTLTATAADGAQIVVSRKLQSVFVSWLPFALVGQNFEASLGTHHDAAERLRTRAEEQIVEGLLEDIAPFVAAHAQRAAATR